MSIDGFLDLSLEYDERQVLSAGLAEWGGPARCTEEMAVALGFRSVADLFVTGGRIADALEAGEALTKRDWVRALLATEVAFASDVLGSGTEWCTTTGFTDEDTLRILRSLQRKIPRGGVLGVVLGTLPL